MSNENKDQLALWTPEMTVADTLGNGILVERETQKDNKTIGRSASVIKRSGAGVTFASLKGLSPKTDREALDKAYGEALDAFKSMQIVRASQVGQDKSFTGGNVRVSKNGNITFMFKKVKIAIGKKDTTVEEAIAALIAAGLTPEQSAKMVDEAIAAKAKAINIESSTAATGPKPEVVAPADCGVTAASIRAMPDVDSEGLDLSLFTDEDLNTVIKAHADGGLKGEDLEVAVVEDLEAQQAALANPVPE